VKFKKIYIGIIILGICMLSVWIIANHKNDKVAIRGVVTVINEENEKGSILVEGNIEEDTEFDKASIYITQRTKIIKEEANERLKLSDIKVGDKVEVIITGPIRESYPVQVDAKIIRIK
jgi:Protein of unknown function (DUF3221)